VADAAGKQQRPLRRQTADKIGAASGHGVDHPGEDRLRRTPAERRLMTSDSANTVHMLVIACGSTPSVMLELLDAGPSVREITSRKRPVPRRIYRSSGNR
jgi:hypothetical protein